MHVTYSNVTNHAVCDCTRLSIKIVMESPKWKINLQQSGHSTSIAANSKQVYACAQGIQRKYIFQGLIMKS